MTKTYEMTAYENQQFTAMNDMRKAWRKAKAEGKTAEAERLHNWLIYYCYNYYEIPLKASKDLKK